MNRLFWFLALSVSVSSLSFGQDGIATLAEVVLTSPEVLSIERQISALSRQDNTLLSTPSLAFSILGTSSQTFQSVPEAAMDNSVQALSPRVAFSSQLPWNAQITSSFDLQNVFVLVPQGPAWTFQPKFNLGYVQHLGKPQSENLETETALAALFIDQVQVRSRKTLEVLQAWLSFGQLLESRSAAAIELRGLQKLQAESQERAKNLLNLQQVVDYRAAILRKELEIEELEFRISDARLQVPGSEYLTVEYLDELLERIVQNAQEYLDRNVFSSQNPSLSHPSGRKHQLTLPSPPEIERIHPSLSFDLATSGGSAESGTDPSRAILEASRQPLRLDFSVGFSLPVLQDKIAEQEADQSYKDALQAWDLERINIETAVADRLRSFRREGELGRLRISGIQRQIVLTQLLLQEASQQQQGFSLYRAASQDSEKQLAEDLSGLNNQVRAIDRQRSIDTLVIAAEFGFDLLNSLRSSGR